MVKKNTFEADPLTNVRKLRTPVENQALAFPSELTHLYCCGISSFVRLQRGEV